MVGDSTYFAACRVHSNVAETARDLSCSLNWKVSD